jgi:hypothetical protein
MKNNEGYKTIVIYKQIARFKPVTSKCKIFEKDSTMVHATSKEHR